MKRSLLQRLGVGLLGLLMLVTVACSGAGGQKSDGQAGTPADKKVALRWVTTGDGGAQPLDQNDRIMEAINEKLNIELTVEIVPESNVEKVNVEMASKNLPDIVTGAYGTTATQSWIDDGSIVELNPYFEGRESLEEVVSKKYDWTADEDGKFYGVPFITQYETANTLIVMRKSWLENVGLEYPETIADMKEVMLAFANDDPDGNGQNDTVAYTDVGPTGNFNWAYSAFGMKNPDYELKEDGTVGPIFESQAFHDGLSFIKEMWDAGAIDKEYMLNDNTKKEEKFYQGSAGMMPAPLFRHVSRIEGNLQELHPDDEIVYGLPPKGEDGGFGLSPQGKNGMFTGITDSCEAPDRAADFLNFMLSEEGNNLLRLGIEGVHYTKDGDTIEFNEEERAKDSFASNGWAHTLAWGSFYWPLESGYLPATEPMRDRALESIELAKEAQIPNLVPYRTGAEVEYGSTLSSLIEETIMEILQGDGEITAHIEKLGVEWRKAGGDKILEDAQEVVDNQ